jgi:hypothetical protein
MADPKELKNLASEIRTLRSQVRKAHKQLEPFVKAVAESLDGISIDDLTAEAKSKFMSDTRQH